MDIAIYTFFVLTHI